MQAWPEFCCAILRDAQGRYLLEHRPLTETAAAGKLICFGGGRVPDEHPDDCIQRELMEELGVVIGSLERCVDLWLGDRLIAWFYRAAAPDPSVIVTEPGVTPAWHAWEEFAHLPIGEWHHAALLAERDGRRNAFITR